MGDKSRKKGTGKKGAEKKAIRAAASGADRYADYMIDLYDGCSKRCGKCYATDGIKKPALFSETDNKKRGKDKRKDQSADESRRSAVDEEMISAIAEQLAGGDFQGKTVLLCLHCDPYPTDEDTRATRAVIEMIKQHGGHVHLMTRNPIAVMRDYDLLDENDTVDVPISGRGCETLDEGAPDTGERIIGLAKAQEHTGCAAWVSCEHVEFPEVIYSMIANLDWIDCYRIDALQGRAGIDWRKFGRKAQNLADNYGREIVFGEELVNKMEAPKEKETKVIEMEGKRSKTKNEKNGK